jgi:hypothetical protein
MGTIWNGDAATARIRQSAAEMLLRMAVTFENEHRKRVSVANPPPYLNSSKAGEYMRLRTGGGQRGLTHEPVDVAGVMKAGFVRVGFTANARHMLILELARDRKGLLQTLTDLRPTLAAMMAKARP